MFTPLFTPRGVMFRRMEGANREFHPRGKNSTRGDNFVPGGSKFAPRGEVENRPLQFPQSYWLFGLRVSFASPRKFIQFQKILILL
jgi:hypothetical protein